ncbi:Fe-S cluster assembly sulfur transfer protein SufU [Marinicella rhabdoformis]|uniref:Fe-S cluster assembly sulfur transfer protein SufU n=1 Tax=Marinicella rhabdoformis TaxID=2580566 RepID=UPI0012AED416|nr:SUF system NifU family Fe-S cluster assembly protein [Marinicella rhabdoformis]
MTDLSKLYKQTILEHNRNPRNYGRPDHWTHHSEGLNAICGDLVHVYLTIEGDVISAINYDGESCAISMASASMMTEFIKGRAVDDALSKFELFCQLMAKGSDIQRIDALEDVNNLITVKKFPSRIKSATLCWHAMAAAIKGQPTATTE